MRTSFFFFAALVLTGCGEAVDRGFSEQSETPTSYAAVVDAGVSGQTSVEHTMPPAAPGTYQVGGSVFGLVTGESLVLQNDAGDDLTFVADGTFTFPVGVTEGRTYAVTVKTPPAHQSCTVRSGHGTMGSANVTDVSVECGVVTYAVGGVVSGAHGNLVLEDGNGNFLQVDRNGIFQFQTTLPIASTYNVTVFSQPNQQQCVVSRATKSGTVGDEAVTSIVVGCTDFPNATFESGFAGWSLMRDAAEDDYGGAAVIPVDATLALDGTIHDVISDADVTLTLDYDALPMTISAQAPSRSGQVGMLCVANGPTHVTATRDLALSSAVSGLSFELQYASGTPTDDDAQFVRVQLLDPTTSAVLTTLSLVGTTSTEASQPTFVTADVSAYAGQTVRLQLEITGNNGPLFAAFDSFTLQ